MKLKAIACHLILVSAFSVQFGLIAHGYEAEMRVIAGRLTSQLEKAGLKSGTVLDFTDLQGQGTELGRFLAQEFSDQLVASAKTLALVDRANLQHLLRENKLSMEGLVNPETTKKLGNLIGIDTVIFGTVTPIGETIRLSVRGVAIETGKIVTSQSVTLAVNRELNQLYPRGVTTSKSVSNNPSRSPSDIRARFRADSIRILANRPSFGQVATGFSGFFRPGINVNFGIENRSGVPIAIAAVTNSTTLGTCIVSALSGLKYLSDEELRQIKSQQDPTRSLQYLPSGGRLSAVAGFYSSDCKLSPGENVDLSMSLIVAAEGQVFTFPASTSTSTASR